ncbi:MAG: type II 3-dehydroquinate dehydratase [Granulosicoccus sp.]
MSQVLVLNGPNLNLLGQREPSTYGSTGLAGIEQLLQAEANQLQLVVQFFQSNSEGALIERVQATSADGTQLVIVNPAGYTHTSVALRDAFLGVDMPLIEVHISNIYRREKFRHHSYFSDIAIGTLAGFGVEGYLMALQAAARYLAANASGA